MKVYVRALDEYETTYQSLIQIIDQSGLNPIEVVGLLETLKLFYIDDPSGGEGVDADG